MARNKYPEKTVERILEVSTRLFFEKGYEYTSIQDILNELKNLSKGAIYHHFKSKEDIFDAICEKMSDQKVVYYNEIMQNNTLNGAEKLKVFLNRDISSIATKNVVSISPNLLNNPKLLAMQLRVTAETVAPKYVLPFIKIGIEDGSITCDKPETLAELISFLLNIWVNPLILGSDMQKLPSKCMLINEMLECYNLTLFDKDTIEKLSNL